jgi:hypothetical protein
MPGPAGVAPGEMPARACRSPARLVRGISPITDVMQNQHQVILKNEHRTLQKTNIEESHTKPRKAVHGLLKSPNPRIRVAAHENKKSQIIVGERDVARDRA